MIDRYTCLEAIMHAEADGNAERLSYWRARLARAEQAEASADPKAMARHQLARARRTAQGKAAPLSGRALRRAMLSRTR